jgi:flagellar protein FliO/FliZ
MFDTSFALKALFTFIVVFAAVALIVWLVRRFGSQRLTGGAPRGRQPRLAVIDHATIDSRRRLVLIRRDNVEHLLMIGGPTDVVIEPHIVRAAVAPREAPRPLPAGETLPRALPLGEGNMWPLQPEGGARAEPMLPRPEPAPRPESMPPRPEQITRPQRPLPPTALQEPVHRERPQQERYQEPMQRTAPEPELPQPSPPVAPPLRERRLRQDSLSGLAEELGRIAPASPEPASIEPSLRSLPRREPRARPQPAPASAPQAAAPGNGRFASPADQNLAEMAQRLEAALRRPSRSEDARPPPPAPKADLNVEPKAESKVDPKAESKAESKPESKIEPKNEAPATPTDAGEELAPPQAAAQPRSTEGAAPARTDARPARSDGKPTAQKSLYDSLEQEMASLLGRPAGKS